ncbi:MAG: HNH endonuclease [PVC group bacterium]|nr:HNH endonuclease [PVC group bacterium]
MTKKEYFNSFKDPKWQKKRLEILERDEFTCRLCKSKDDQLHAHHTVYYEELYPWEYYNYQIITLCDKCHKDEHNGLYENLSIFSSDMRGNGFLSRELVYISENLHFYADKKSFKDEIMFFVTKYDFCIEAIHKAIKECNGKI